MLQHVLLSRSHDPFLARVSLFSAIQQQCPLFTPALSSIPRHGLAARGGGEPEQSRILAGRMLAQTQSDAGSVQPEDASNAPGPSNTDLLDFSDPRVAPTPEHASATAEPKCKAKPASLLRPDPPELPEDCIPAHASEVKESVPLEPAPEEISMPEPPHVRAPWAQLTEEEREEQLAREEQPEHPWHDRIDGTPQNQSLGPHHACTKHRLRGPNSLPAGRSTRRMVGLRRKATLVSRLCMGSRGRTTGPIGQTTGTSARCPTRLPAGIPPRIPTASTQHMPPTNALRHTACITPETRAAFVQQLEACIRIPSVRLPRTMRRMEMQGRGLRVLYLDDNNRISCCLPCANSACPYDAVCGQYVVDTSTDTHDRHRCSGCVADARNLNR